MKNQIVRAYVYQFECPKCGEHKPIYFATPDFGDAPIILKCRDCDTLYWYTKDDEYYFLPVEQKIKNLRCCTCSANLENSLVKTYTHIKCCDEEYELDEGFLYSISRDDNPLVDVNVNLLY